MAVSQGLDAQPAVYETEPNNTPAEANPVSGEVALYGTMVAGDQDGFLWTVSDDDARKRWKFELHGIPGALTIAELVRVDYTDDGSAVAGVDRLMKMGTRDGLTPSIHDDQLLEPGDYLIGIAYAGGPKEGGGGAFRPPLEALSFGEGGDPEGEVPAAPAPGAWRFLITPSAKLSVQSRPGPRDSREKARKIRPGGEFATFETLEKAWYSFSFDEKQSAQRWDIEVRAPIGRDLRARLLDSTGQELASGKTDAQGRIRFPDLAPNPSTWYVELTAPKPGFVHWVSSQSVGQRVEGEEAEPNDAHKLANRVDFSQPVTGRIGGDDSADHFLFTIDEARADQLQTLRIEAEPAVKLQLCLGDTKGYNIQCRSDTTPVELPDLMLPAGDYRAIVARATEATYSLTLTPQGPIEAGVEAEPNDTIAYASGVPANLRIKGRFHGTDADFFKFLVPDEAQLWRFQLVGDELHEIGYYDGSKSQKETQRASAGQRRLRLDNVFLLPGTHYIRVSGRDGGEYTLLARPLGPPDPNGEIEPNDQHAKQRLAIGQTRTGMLPEKQDKDHYRFFLANWDHIRLKIMPPADGVITPQLKWYDGDLGRGVPGGPGEPLEIAGLFPPGDYHLVLSAHQASDADYELSLERLPRFSCASDCEPNGIKKVWLAAPLPPSLVLEGQTGEWGDWDYYQLPAFESPTEIIVRSAEPVRTLGIGPRYRDIQKLQHDPELGGYRATVPAGAAQRLMIDTRGAPYRLQVDFPLGPLGPVIRPLAADLALELETEEVSAYRLHGQTVKGALHIENSGDTQLDAELAVATSDYRWSVALDRERVEVAPNGRVTVPLTVTVPADAWAERPVRVSVAAFGAHGRQVETWGEIEVGRDAVPVDPVLWWAIPESLRGGFNAAWIPFGGEWTEDSTKVTHMDLLRDGLVFNHTFMGTGVWTEEEERPYWTVDLPGDQPVPVAGMAINQFGTPGPFVDIRQGTLLLSIDGNTFEEALSFEAQPVKTEQHFAVDRPVQARFARLRVDATFEEASNQRMFGAEWKVILEPGFDLSAGSGFNLADRTLGGHVVSDWPPRPYSPSSILDHKEDEKPSDAHTPASRTKEYVIGFLQNRAAQIEKVEWHWAAATEERFRNFGRVEVTASTTSPVGPWRSLGGFDVGSGNSSASLDLDEPTWARFVRFTAHLAADAKGSRAPGVIRIWERPTSEDYLSVLTEWGDLGPRAFFEQQAGLDPEPSLVASGNDSKAKAKSLQLGAATRGAVSLGKQEHWYRIAVPSGQNVLTLDLNGDPTVRTVLHMEDVSGARVPLRRSDQQEEPGRHQFEAVVSPGSELFLRVSEPPRNVVFSWDTSASVGAYIPQINSSLVAFSGEVVPGQEAVNLMPFSLGPLLEEWYGEPYVLQTVLNDYRRGQSSSSAERTLKGAALELSPLAGTKAIMVITDGATVHDGGMWGPMRQVQPRIFAVQVAGDEMWNQHVMRNWADINGGHFTQLVYDGEMEVAFDRASTLMHRPAGYTLKAGSDLREAPGPGYLQVMAGDGGTGAGGTVVELILDASGSMLQRMEGKRRIAIAKEVLTEAVREHIPAGTPVALRVFGHKEPDACRTDLEIPLAPLDPDAAAAKIAGINAMNLARTPIAASLAAAEGDLKGAKGGVIVLVTDGEETCEGDPAAVVTALREKGLDVNLNIVGLAIDDAELAAQFKAWAELGGGEYFAADDQGGLSEAIEDAMRVPFTVFDQGGNEVASGQIGGEPVELEQRAYRVVVHSSPQKVLHDVEILAEETTTVSLD